MLVVSVLCNPHVKTVKTKVGCHLHRLAFLLLDTQCLSYVPTAGTSPMCLPVILGADLKR